MRTGGKIVGISSNIALLAFFLPWVVVSCGAQPVIEMSGYDMATGHVSSVYATSNETIDGRPLLYIALGTAVVGVYIFITTYFNEKIASSFNVIQVGLGILGIAAILLTVAQIRSESAGGTFPTGISLRYGFWLSIMGQAGMTIGGILNVADSRKKNEIASSDVVRQLSELGDLHNQNIIDDEEFKRAKQRILGTESSIGVTNGSEIEEHGKEETADQRAGLLSRWVGVLKTGKAQRAIALATIASFVSWHAVYLPNDSEIDWAFSNFSLSFEGIALWLAVTGLMPLALGLFYGLMANALTEKEEWTMILALVFGAIVPIGILL